MAARDIVPYPDIPHTFRRVLGIDGHYINDHCIARRDDEFHLFCILGEVGKSCYTPGNEVIIGHAVSGNFSHWTVVDHALTVETEAAEARPWEAAHIFAPYVLDTAAIGGTHRTPGTAAGALGRFYMYYSSDNHAKAQYINLAVSDDLYQWRRFDGNPVLTPPGWAVWDSEVPCSCRDAHVLWDPDYGHLLYYVADLPRDPEESCIAVARSTDLLSWDHSQPVLSRRHSSLEAFECKTESPCVVRRNGLYYLFYRHGNGTKFAVSPTPLSWDGCDSYLLGPLHAAEILEIDNRWYATSCSRPIGDLAHTFDRTDGFFVGSLVWDGDWPRLL